MKNKIPERTMRLTERLVAIGFSKCPDKLDTEAKEMILSNIKKALKNPGCRGKVDVSVYDIAKAEFYMVTLNKPGCVDYFNNHILYLCKTFGYLLSEYEKLLLEMYDRRHFTKRR